MDCLLWVSRKPSSCDASKASPRGCVSGMFNQKVALQTWRKGPGEEFVGPTAETAAPVTRTKISGRRSDGLY